MANYTIIGGDQKQYGPVTTEEIRQWLAEGRLNAQTLAKGEGDAEFRQLSMFPELADAFTQKAPAPGVITPGGPSAAFVCQDRDYDLDIGGCVSRGYHLLKNNFNVLFVSSLIYALIEGVLAGLAQIPFTGPIVSLVNLIITGPLLGGVFYIFIRTVRGRPAEVGDVFEGFRNNFGQLFLGYLVPALLAGLCLLPVVIAAAVTILPALIHHEKPNEYALLFVLPVLLICLIPMVYLQISWTFTLPLIADRGLDFWPAMKMSRRMVGKHWWQVFGLMVLVGLLNVAGLLACCVGVLFTLPVGIAAMMYAYETIFRESAPQDS